MFRSGTPIKLFDTRGYFAPAGDTRRDVGRTYDVSADGRRFLMIENVSEREGTPPQSITVIQNWVEELKRRVTRN